ncbi:MAG: VWA domain-containing protein [Anaerolineales bacterium]|nr:VWA domain-containing protein [Anaerolineales bacterium]
MPELLNFTSVCNRSSVPVMDQSQLLYILTEVSPASSISGVRMPLNFALVLDRSGSMAGEKLRTLKEAVKQIIAQLSEDDILSIVTFESRTEVLAPAKPGMDRKALLRAVEKIRDGGGTNMAPALKTALELVKTHHDEKRVNRIVLLTDGEATDSVQNSYHAADEAGSAGVPIICLGFGQDWNESFLFELADRSILARPGSQIGMADYIPKPDDVEKIFQEVYQSMQIVANDLAITIRMVQGLEARRVWQVAPLIRELGSGVIEGRAIQIPIGQIDRTGCAVLAEVSLPPRPEGAVRIAQADVTFSTPDHGPQRQSIDLVVDYSAASGFQDQLNSRVMNIVEKVQAFRLQTQALDDARVGDVRSATRKLRQAVTILLAQGETDLANQMEKEADHLESSGDVSNEGKKTIMLTSRKTVRLSE